MFHPERGQEPSQEESPSIDLQRQIDRLTKTGVHLPEIVKLLGAEEYLHDIGTAKNPVLQFDVKSFIESRSPEGERVILPSTFVHTRDVILPPDQGEIMTGSGTGLKEMEIIPRTARLIRLLSELNLRYSVVEGTNDPKMMRELSYRIFDIPEIGKVAFVNDEEGNATFVINNFNSETERTSDYASLTKDQLRELPAGKMTLVVYPGALEEWAIAMRAALEDQKKPYEATTPTAVERIGREDSKDKIQYEKAPHGWMTRNGLAQKLNVGTQTIQRIVDQQRELRPTWVKEYLNSDNRLLDHYSPGLVEFITTELSARESAPVGWTTISGLTHKLEVGKKLIIGIAEKQRQAHPEWFAEYLDASNKVGLHYGPELVEYITKEIAMRGEQAPEGWMTKFGLAKGLRVDSRTIQRITDRQKEEHPDWFKDYLDKSSHPAIHYSPELVEYITNELSIREQAPEGWMTIKGLRNKFGSAGPTITGIAEKQRQAHPEWFAEYLDESHKVALHYSPELVEYITKEIAMRGEQAPGGWMTNGGLANKLNAGFEAIKRIADKQKEAHPEWFKEYLDSGRHPIAHYSPELVEYITKEFSTREQSPDGWMTNHGLAQRLGVGTHTIKGIADQQRREHPEWFKEYLNISNRFADHYSPELVEYITKKIKS